MTADSPLRIHARILVAREEDRTVLLDLDAGWYFALDGVGHEIWHALEEGARASEIVDRIAVRYDAPRERIRADVDRLLGDLLARRILE